MKLPFRKNMTQKIESKIAALVKRSAQLDAQRSAAQATLEKATQARQDALLGADDIDEQKLAKLQRAVGDAASLLQGIDDAIGILGKEKAQAEAQLAAERDRIARDAAASKLAEQVSTIEMALRPWLEKSRVLADAMAELHWHFECGQMTAYVQNCMARVETAMNFHAPELNMMPKAIRDGSMPIPAPKPTSIAPPPPAVTQEPPFKYHPLKGGPTFKGATERSPNIDPALAAAGFRVLDRSSEERVVMTEGPRL
jgi:chromosome segregation ATPase